MKKYIIYKLIDPRDNQIRYVGMTSKTLKVRLNSHLHDKNCKSHKINWIKSLKSIELSPIIEMIEEGIENFDKACEREIYWIKFYTNEGIKLTNTEGGGSLNKEMSEDTKNKISIKSKARFEKEEEILKLKISNKKYEDSKTEEQKINDILKQNPKKVIQFDLQMNKVGEYLSIRDAAKKTKIDRKNISSCCKKKVISAGGFIWRLEGDVSIRTRKKRKTKQVLQFDLNENFIKFFNSTKEAASELGISQVGIISCCVGKYKHSNGFIWKYK